MHGFVGMGPGMGWGWISGLAILVLIIWLAVKTLTQNNTGDGFITNLPLRF